MVVWKRIYYICLFQSIGEPSTQMTLNTFQFADQGEMNKISRIKYLLKKLTRVKL